jgi:1-acyl-sn-glycerol-3-phosphate acyltransferase
VYLLTGVTGFLGKIVLEQLVRRREELGISRIVTVIRPRGRRNAETRFRREVVAAECLRALPDGWTRHVEVLEGVLEQPGLAVDRVTRDRLAARVTHIIHAAASVEFHLPVAEAARSNVTTALNVLDVARACPALHKLVLVSTAYVTPHPGNGAPIPDGLAPLPRPAEEMYRSILDGSARDRDLLAACGQPNSYTLTKALAEHLVVARAGDVPLAIVRPSIISASWRHPFPGWIDSQAGFAAFVVLLGLGHMRAVVADPDARLDLIPVDEAATRVLDACHAPEVHPLIHHAVAGYERSASVRECWTQIRDFFSVHRVARRPTLAYLGPPGWRFALADALHHRLAARLGTRGRPRARGDILTRLAHLNNVFPYFTSNSFAFRPTRPLEDAFDPREYVTTVSRGVYRHLLGEDDTQWTLAGRGHHGPRSDLAWALRQPRGTSLLRVAAWATTKVLRRCFDRVTVDVPSFEAARRATPPDRSLVIVLSHRSYFDFVLGSYLFFARPDLGMPIPHIAAAIEFGRIPLLGRLLRSLHAFYLRRGQGREDPELTRRVHALLDEGKSIEFFIEGQRSRSREYLPPKRGLLRCIQSSGKSCTILPVTVSYDRVPEERSFARELAGAPKPTMRLRPLMAWTLRVLRGKIDLGRAHIACGAPIRLDRHSDVRAVSHQVIDHLKLATVSTTFHLRAFLETHAVDGVDDRALRAAIEQRGGRVLASDHCPADPLDPLIAGTLRHHFAHLFEDGDGLADETAARLRAALFGARADALRQTEPVA